jgi:dihydrofolate reductase
LVLGRVTYQELEGFRPKQVDDETRISDYRNHVAKYVVSANLDRADWSNTTILRGDVAADLTALKRKPGTDIVITGGAGLVRSLAPTGLVDVYRLLSIPSFRAMAVGCCPTAWLPI